MIKKIVHLADIHIRKSTARHQEYRLVFNSLVTQLKEEKPDRIVIVGDLFHDYIKLEGELLILSSEFLNNLVSIAPVVITRGNHDIARNAPHRTDTIEALVTTMRNPRITYYNTTGLFEDENVVWAVWKHGEKKNNPWEKNYIKDPTRVYIDLFHDPINGSVNTENFKFNSKTYRSPKDFMGDISLFGDIHKLQYLDAAKTKAYSSSLVEQNFSEGNDEFHGYVVWDLKSKQSTPVTVHNNYGHFTLDVNRFTDFENLQFKIDGKAEKKRIRIKWKTLPNVKTTENSRKVDAFLMNKFAPISIKHVNDFLEEKKISVEEQSDIENIAQRQVMHKVISEYLDKMGTKPEIIQEVLDLDVEIENRTTVEDLTNIQWSILSVVGKNFRSYEDLRIDWSDQDGLYQIVGENGVGKSTFNQLLTYILFGRSLETDFRKKHGDARFINNKLNTDYCFGAIRLEANGEYYGIKRTTTTKKNKEGELSAASTVVEYFKLDTATDELEDKFNIKRLSENDRTKTQKKIDEIIGTYDNFIRVTLTTSDTLNSVLSSDKAEFIDALLYDSGLNVFDVRLQEFKKYKSELIIDRSLSNLNVQNVENSIAALTSNINLKKDLISTSKDKMMEHRKNYDVLNGLKETLLESMHQIDQELSNSNETDIKNSIKRFQTELGQIENDEYVLTSNINGLLSTYDSVRLDVLQKQKDEHKTNEFAKRSQIQKKKMDIIQYDSAIGRVRSEINQLTKEGSTLKTEILDLKNSPQCPTCGQMINSNVGHSHSNVNEVINKSIKDKEVTMFGVADKIKLKKAEIPVYEKKIDEINIEIFQIEKDIQNDSINLQSVQEEIGKILNAKTEVEKRNYLLIELEKYPLKKENLSMKINEVENKLAKFYDQKTKIEENQKLRQQVNDVNGKMQFITGEIENHNRSIAEMENIISYNETQIKNHYQAIKDYLEFEKKEEVRKLYEEIVHRDGIPTQILSDILLPKINNVLSKLLESADFDVYLDKDDLRLKFFYNDHPNAIIDCISASGMERTFAVYSLKIALNQINCKSKSTLLTVDEVMGKLKGEYVDMFVNLLHLSKKFYKKVLIIEPTHEVNPDYLLHVEKDSRHVSKLILN